MSSEHKVMLPRTHPAGFRRTIRKPEKKKGVPGDVTRVIEFNPGDVEVVSAAEFKFLQKDIDKGMLVEVRIDGKGRPRPTIQPAELRISMPKDEYEAKIASARSEGIELGRDAAISELASEEAEAELADSASV